MRWRSQAHIDHYYNLTEETYNDNNKNYEKIKFIGSSRISVESNYAKLLTTHSQIWHLQNNSYNKSTRKKELITRRIYWIKWSQTNTFNVKLYENSWKNRHTHENKNKNKYKQSPCECIDKYCGHFCYISYL